MTSKRRQAHAKRMVDNVRASPYQQRDNTTGFITANDIGHVIRHEPCQNFHNARTSIYDAKPLQLVMPNPLPRGDNFITTSEVFHKPKFYEHYYYQPEYRKAPGLENIHYIRPEFHRKVVQSKIGFNPIYDKSETHDQFQPRRAIFDIYGGPRIHIPTRNVYTLEYKDYIYPFDPAENSVLKLTHPYLTTNQLYHREFTPDERDRYATLDEIEKSDKLSDVAIKLRVRPMHDPFEQKLDKLGITPNLDVAREACDFKRANRKTAFKRQLYTGPAPRTCPPIEYFGTTTSYNDTYSRPLHRNVKENTTRGLKFCFIQPGLSSMGAMRTPNMYSTETGVYGNGRGVDAFVRIEHIPSIVNPKRF